LALVGAAVSAPEPGAEGAVDAAAAGDSAGACAKAGRAIAPASSTAVNIETVRFISFSFFLRVSHEPSESLI
jgi:hypothetical protein